jgi:homoserine kinase type II
MAVYTRIQVSDLDSVMARFELGEVLSLRGIGAGIENTNYFLDTQRVGEPAKPYVLTIFENLDASDLPYFNLFTSHLAAEGLSVPAPVVDSDGASLFMLAHKNAIIVPCLQGAAIVDPKAAHCRAAGEWLGQMHIVQQSFTQTRPLVRDLEWMRGQQSKLSASQFPEADQRFLDSLIARYESYRLMLEQCPQGTVHGDLFRDNVLFEGPVVSGVIDFYHACTASLLFDLAVCANDWATHADGGYQSERLDALVDGYRSIRPWTRLEMEAWPKFLEVAALRFWISRLSSKYVAGYQQESVEGEPIKDPDEMKRILEHLLGDKTSENV